MELKEFIRTTLLDITNGVSEAGKINKQVSPILTSGSMFNDKQKHTFVDFDIAVTTSEENSKNGGAEVKVLSINLGGKKENRDEIISATRIKFSVPVYLSHSRD